MTPRLPSSQPPFGTVSLCEPTRTARVTFGLRPMTVPYLSVLAARPDSDIFLLSHERAATSSLLKAGRLTPVLYLPQLSSSLRSAISRFGLICTLKPHRSSALDIRSATGRRRVV